MLTRQTLIALTALLSLTLTNIPSIMVAASPCVVFDADFNLFLLGAGGKDYSLGQQSTWSSPTASDVTTSGRPPFDGTGTTCYLSQFNNAIYVMNGDKSNPSDVGIYNPATKSWSTQKVNTDQTGGSATFSPSSFDAILDHDTNVFYALSGGTLFFADFGQLKAANSSAISWTDVGSPSFSVTNYKPVMALAQNHIHFLNVPGAAAGTAQIFVIHFSFFQPDAQKYPITGSSDNFPETDGQAVSLFQPLPGVQQEFAFIPTDGSKTYVINVETNTTAALAGPTDKSASTFTTSITSLVQLTTAGDVFFLPYKQGDSAGNAGAQWSKITLTGVNAGSTGSNGSSTNGSSTTGSSGGGNSTTTGSAPGATGSGKSGALALSVNMLGAAGLMAFFAALL